MCLYQPIRYFRSEGNERRKWIGACKKELDNLTSTQTIEPISADDLTRLRRTARSTGNKLIELPAKGVFTIKPDKYKVRFVACGNKTAETYGKVATTDLDPGMMRYLLSWAASSPSNSISTLDVTAAFLNAPLPTGRIVILKPPSILYKLQLIPPGHVWLIHKAIYGLRESPLLWSEERTQVITRITICP